MDLIDNYKALGYAVVTKAVEDYKRSVKTIKKYNGMEIPSEKLPCDLIWAMKIKKDCERFFNGSLISVYCEYDGVRILNEINKQVI